jgi:hypothetical protein
MGRQKSPARGFFVGVNRSMATFITPYSGTAELTASTGLEIREQNNWLFSKSGYNDGATFGVSLGGPTKPAPGAAVATADSGLLSLEAENWLIGGITNQLISYTDPDTGITYGADRCRITVQGQWIVIRKPNPNSMNFIGSIYQGRTETDLGDRDMSVNLLNFTSPIVSYVIQGSAVDGGAQNTFSSRRFFCRCRESCTTDNSNRAFQSNSTARPAWVYDYQISWQTS